MEKIIRILVLVFVAASFVLALIAFNTRPRVVYVDINKLYSEFALQKELDAKLVGIKSARKHILDSLKITLESMAMRIREKNLKTGADLEKFENLRQDYMIKNKQFDEDNTALAQQYYQQIITQLNQYVKDFGETGNYTVIMGANGNGSLMYAKPNIDITQKVQEYINQRYNGKTK